MHNELIHSETRIIEKILSGACEYVMPSGQAPKSKSVNVLWKKGASTRGEEFYYINNPSGTIRWFFPKRNKYPVHLALYNSSGIKARAYKLATHVAFSTGQKNRLVSGAFQIEGVPPLYDYLKAVPHDSLAIFTGTPGENRKSIIALNEGRKTTYFGKLAHSPKGMELLKNEAAILSRLGDTSLQFWKCPKAIVGEHAHLLLLSNVAPVLARDSGKISDLHIKALMELYQAFGERAILGELEFYEEIQQQLEDLEDAFPHDPSLDPEQIHRMIRMLKRLFAQLDPEAFIYTSLSHRDFTPWNMYLSSDRIHVYDWELAQSGTPFFYDLFHFIFQGGILLHRHPFRLIHLEIQRALRLPTMNLMNSRYHLDGLLYYQLYLLHLITYYLKIYVHEPNVHMQVHWLLKTWEEALEKAHQPIL